MKDIWTNRLSEYIDGELDATERDALESHLATCGHCYATLAELRDVVGRAKTLVDREPAKDLWAGIRAGIDEQRDAQLTPGRQPATRRRFSFSVPQLLAASIALVLMSGGTAWLALRNEKTLQPTPTPVADADRGGIVRPARWIVESDQAIAELQDALEL